jgi:hypothetical protein
MRPATADSVVCNEVGIGFISVLGVGSHRPVNGALNGDIKVILVRRAVLALTFS